MKHHFKNMKIELENISPNSILNKLDNDLKKKIKIKRLGYNK